MVAKDESTRLQQALLGLDRASVAALVRGSIDADTDAGERARFVDRVVSPALFRIGEGWERGTVALSQVYMAGRILDGALRELAEPPVLGCDRGPIAVGVLGDRHTLGKALVISVLRCGGYEIIDLGGGLTPERFVQGALDADARIVMASVLMFNRALEVSRVRSLLDRGAHRRTPLVVGGAPFVQDPTLADRVGADAWGRSAADALRIARELLGPAT